MTDTGSVRLATLDDFSAAISTEGLGFEVGPFRVHVRSRLEFLHETLYRFYRFYPVVDRQNVFTLHAELQQKRRLPRLHRPRVRFLVDGFQPHDDNPLEQALAVLEWGINLVIAMRSHAYLLLHAAVLERNGCVLVLPATPGSGKSTLAAALAHHGWRLFSDEFGIVRPGTREFLPAPRPVALKNDSIAVIRDFCPQAVVGPEIPNTRKGTVAHVRPPEDSIRRQAEAAPVKWIVFPRWQRDAQLELAPMTKSQGFVSMAMNAFNYELLGEAGFSTVTQIIPDCDCFSLVYSNLDEAVAALGELS